MGRDAAQTEDGRYRLLVEADRLCHLGFDPNRIDRQNEPARHESSESDSDA
jgi:hypothetical protein